MTARPSRPVSLHSVSDRTARCSCGAEIRWAKTARFKNIALEADAVVERVDAALLVSSDHVHFARCPHAARHRRLQERRKQRAAPQRDYSVQLPPKPAGTEGRSVPRRRGPAPPPPPSSHDVYPRGRPGPRGSTLWGD